MKAQIKGPGAVNTEPPLTNNNPMKPKYNLRFRSMQQRHQLYESLKQMYTFQATSKAEFDAGVKRAIRESGV